MFYGQNCSGRLGEKRTAICVVGSKEDVNFFKLINTLNLKYIKIEIYIRKESEYPSNRIIVADLFARGYFKGFDCNS